MGYFDHLMILICIYIILAVSMHLVLGMVGMLNLGHAAFFGIGAYTSALLVKSGFPWIGGLLAGALLAALFGVLIGIPSLKLRGDYLAIATLGFGEITRSVFLNWQSVTRGPLGIPGIPKPELFGWNVASSIEFLLLVLVICIIVVFLVYRLTHSPFGRILRGIREDEIALMALGKNTSKYKLWALGIGAFIAGLAGSLFAHYITFIDPSSFAFFETVLVITMVVLGGLGSLLGAVVGAIILVLLPEPLRFLALPTDVFAAFRLIIYSLVLIIIMIKKPSGLFSEKVRKHEPS